VQDLDGCKGTKALEVIVACVDPPVTYDPSQFNLFPVGFFEYSKGKAKGSVYYPAEDDGQKQVFNQRLAKLGRVPIVFMAHGNHTPGSPSYRGYDYFQQDLAKMGIVAVSVDCNALNGMGYSIQIIEGRADLIIESIKYFQSLDGDASSVFYHHIDSGRVGLMGHSQGGEAVVLVPEVINVPGVKIKAVLALAPTEGGATSRKPKDYAFMTILPAGDGDVWPNDGAIFYDQAAPAPFKSQLYVHFTNHEFYNRQWLDDDSLWFMAAPTPPVMLRYEHERVLTSYGCALFRATLLGHGTASFLSGHELPANVQTQNVHLSFARAGAVTVDDHEQGYGIGMNSLGQPNTQSAGMSADVFQFHQGAGAYNASFYGETVGMVTRPGTAGRTFASQLDKKRDFSKSEIWIRTAEVTDGSQIVGNATGFELGLQDANGVIAWVDSDEVGGLPRPYPRKPGTIKTMLNTLRFHGQCFKNKSRLDLTLIQAILIRCNRHDEHAFAFDDLQVVS
jgi:dienelactone hydrolase